MKKFILGLVLGILGSASIAFASINVIGTGLYWNDSSQILSIGTSTSNALFQVTATTTNATSSIEIGKRGQNKGSCIKMYRYDGTGVYITVNNANALVVSTVACVPSV